MSKRRPPHKAEPHLYVIATVNKNPIPKYLKSTKWTINHIAPMKNRTKPKLKFIKKFKKSYKKIKFLVFNIN